ncbi:response regulator [Granulicella sp. dw_53]|uniref:response regulator n=1 Tax=Granulicella sp. dw_53 TaxID=2719792 RepID=UPI001BD2B91D|nr:response regulator [Granulicella sp. dw_53]
MALINILLVDDDELICSTLATLLERRGFAVTMANCVFEALKLISSCSFEVLLSDLHMPGPGDGLTVVSAMRHANPKAVTILLSAFPEMDAAAQAILMQADQILVKPMDVDGLVKVIKDRLAKGAPAPRSIKSIAAILESTIEETIEAWLKRVEKSEKVMVVSLSREERTGYLDRVLMDLVVRLRSLIPLGSDEFVSAAAHDHGLLRRQQGYTAAMMIEESRMLQVSIFETLQRNLGSIDFSVLLLSVMTIADEVDAQLSQAMDGYRIESISDALPA